MHKSMRGLMAGLLLLFAFPAVGAADRVVTDGVGRDVSVPAPVEHVICSGPGALRLLTYLQVEEKIVQWDPDVLFVDLSSLQMGEGAGALFELKTDPAYQTLSAVRACRCLPK